MKLVYYALSETDLNLDRSIVVPEGEAEKTGLRQDQVKVSQLYGGGFPANVEGLHHLHCLVSM